ncbi:MAG: M16 family metallopeptidase, partial [Gammaproteobacteria bacterium]
GKIPRPARKLPAFWTVEPTQDGERTFTVRRQGDIQIVALGYKVPAALHADSDALSFASSILANAPTGRLHKLLVESGKASEVFAYGETGYAPGMQYFGAVVKKGEALEPVRAALTAAVEDFATQPPTAAELERARRGFTNDIEKSLNDPQRVGVALSEAIALGDWRLFFTSRERVANMTAAEVAAAAGRYLRRDNRVTGEFIPEDAPRRAEIPAAPTPQAVLATFKPSATVHTAEAFEPSQANIMKRTLLATVGGIKLALLPKKNRGEAVSVDLRLHWGDEKNLFGRGAVPELTHAMLARGTSRYTREQLADEFDRLKITGSLMQFETTRTHLAEALRLVAHVLREANFPQAEFEQLRQQSLVALEASRNEPEALAERALAEHYDHYPKGDVRASQSIDEEIADLKAATLEQVKAFHRDFYGASQGELAIVGDFDPAPIPALIEGAFYQWPSRASYAPIQRTVAPVAPISRVLDAPDKENGVVTARLDLELNVNDADYPALLLANHIFGDGGLDSRLMKRIRQKDGLSYGGGSHLAAGDIDRAGSFGISAIAAPSNLARVDAAIRQELARAVQQGFTAAELADAKSGLLQERVQNRTQDGIVASSWVNYLYLGQTFAWSEQLEAKLRAVTLADLNAAFRRAIDPAKLSVVAAGDRQKAASAKAAVTP